MELTTFLLIFIVGFLLYVSSKRPKNFPDGIRRIPIIGQVIMMMMMMMMIIIGQGFRGTKPPLHLWRTHKLMGHFIGNRPAVTIQNFSLAKDLFSKDEWCGRGLSIISRYFRSDSGINKVSGGVVSQQSQYSVTQGIISADGQRWLEHRRFALKHLKDFGFGKVGLEGVIQEEADEIMKQLGGKENKDHKMNTDFGVPVINILWTIVAGKRFQAEDPQVQRMMDLLNRYKLSKQPRP